MKSTILIVILMGLILFSCQNQSKSPDAKEGKKEIVLNGLNDEHPNKKQMQWFLNNYDEEFIADKKDRDSLLNENLIQKEYYFHTKLSDISLILIFCKNQQDALTIGETNFFSNDNNQKYGINGSVLFVVKGEDKLKVNNVLSWFSGEE